MSNQHTMYIMNDSSIEFMLYTEAVFPTPPGEYHYKKMPMEIAYAIEAALQEKGDYFGKIGRASHPDADYPEPNPNPYHSKINPYQCLVGFRFEVQGTRDIREAYDTVFSILNNTLGEHHGLRVEEVGVSRMDSPRGNRYHPIYNPHAEPRLKL